MPSQSQLEDVFKQALNDSDVVEIEDEGGNAVKLIAEELSHGDLADSDIALVTYIARALQAEGLDELRMRVHDSSGAQIDPLTQDPLASVGNDELRSRILGVDGGGSLQEANLEQFNTDLGLTDVGLATYISRSLSSLGQDEVRVASPSPLDASAATVTVTDNGSFSVSSGPLDGSLGSNDTDHLLVQENSALDVSAATVNVQEASALDVSGATVTVADDGAFAVNSGPLDGTLASNGTDELRSRLLGVDGGGTLQEVNVEQFNTALASTDVGVATYGDRALASLGQDEVRVSSPNALDVSAATVTVTDNGAFSVSSGPLDGALGSNGTDHLLVQENSALDVSAATVNVQEATALDVSAATVTVTDNGAFAVSSGPLDGALNSNSTDELRSRLLGVDAGGALQEANAEQFNTQLGSTDVGIATYSARALGDVAQDHVRVQEATALDVSAATVNVQEASALDVSAATVTVTDNGSFNVAGAVGIDDTDVSDFDTSASTVNQRSVGIVTPSSTGPQVVGSGGALDVSAATVTVTDNGAFNVAGTVTVDDGGSFAVNSGPLDGSLASSGTDELRTRLLGADAGGALQEANAEQFGTALASTDVGIATYGDRALASLGQDEVRVSSPNALDVSAATVTVTDNGSFAVSSGPLDGALGSNATDHLLVQENSALDVSAATVNVQEATALDVSAATVTVTDNGSFAVSSGPLDGALNTNSTDELRSRLLGADAGGALQEANAEQFNTQLGSTDVGIATYISRALGDIAQDEVRVSSPNALDVSAATVTVTDNGSFNIAGTSTVTDDGNFATAIEDTDVSDFDTSASTVNQRSVGIVTPSSTGPQTVGSGGALDVSAATVNVQEATALDVSGATVTVTDNGSFSVSSGPLDGSLSSNGTDELRSRILGADAGGVLQEVNAEQFNTALGTGDVGVATYGDRALASLAQDEVRVDTSPSEPLDVSAATVNVQEATALDVSGATVTVTDNGAFNIAGTVTVDDGGSFAVNSGPLDGSLASSGTDELRSRILGVDGGGVLQEANAEQFNTGLATTDVGIATYSARALNSLGQDHLLVQENSALDVSAATVNVQEATALDVSGATVTVTDNGAFNVAGTVTVDDGGSFAVNSGPLDGVLNSNSTDELRARLLGADSGGALQEANAEQFNTNLGTSDVGIATYGDRALESVGQDELRSKIEKRHGEVTTLQDPSGDISGGVNATLTDNDGFTLFLNAGGAVDITVELSPNGGTNVFEPPESPIQFTASDDDVVKFGYDADWIRLTGSDTTNVLAIVREVV